MTQEEFQAHVDRVVPKLGRVLTRDRFPWTRLDTARLFAVLAGVLARNCPARQRATLVVELQELLQGHAWQSETLPSAERTVLH